MCSRSVKASYHRLSTSIFTFLFLLILTTFFSTSLASAATVSWNTDSNGDWDTAANWSSGAVPGPNDDVVINRPGVEVVVTISTGGKTVKSVTVVDSLSVLGGSLRVTAGASVISGTFKLNNAQLFVQGSSTTFTATGAANIDNGRFDIQQGGVAAFPNVTSYDTTDIPGQNVWVVNVDGAGSRLDLSSVTQLKGGYTASFSFYYQMFRAVNNGLIDFSGLQNIITPSAAINNELVFYTLSAGQILLPALSSIVGEGMEFNVGTTLALALVSIPAMDISVQSGTTLTFSNLTILPVGTSLSVSGVFNVPSVTTFAGGSFGISGILNAPSLTMIAGGNFSVSGSSQFNAVLLTSVNNTTLNFSGSGVFNVPALLSLTKSTLNLNGSGAQFNSGFLINIDNTFFNISNGATFNKIAATSYDTTDIPGQNVWVVNVDGTGSKLDLSSVTQLKGGYTASFSFYYQMFRAVNNGVIDFSGLQNIITPSAAINNELVFYTLSAGQILLPALSSIVGEGMEFNISTSLTLALTSIPAMEISVQSGGTLTFSNLISLPTGSSFSITGVLNVPNVTTIAGGSFSTSGIFNASSLATVTGGNLSISGSGQFNAVLLTSVDNATLGVSGSGVFNMPALVNLTKSTLNLNGSGAQFNSGFITNIDNTFFNISNGAVFDKIIATSYDTTSIPGQNVWVVNVDGTGSKLDLSSVTQLKGGYTASFSFYYQMFRAVNNGVLDFSGLQSIITPSASLNNEVVFYTVNGGQILLSALSSIVGEGMEFNVSTPLTLTLTSIPAMEISVQSGGALTFSNLTNLPTGTSFSISGVLNVPSVTTIAGGSFSTSGIFNAPNLTTVTGGNISVSGSGQFNAVLLTSIDNATLSLSGSGVFNVPVLTSLTKSTLNLNGSGAQFNSGFLTNIDNTFFNISNGAVFNRIAATSYDTTGILGQNIWVVIVDGVGSRLDLSSVTQLKGGYTASSSFYYQMFRAVNNGVIDFSGLQSIITPSAAINNEVIFYTLSGGQILLSALSSIVGEGMEFNIGSAVIVPLASIPPMEVSVQTGGVLTFSNLTNLTVGTSLSISGVLNAPQLTTITGGNISISTGGQFNSVLTTNIDNATLTMSGAGVLNMPALINVTKSTLSLSGNGAQFNSGFLTNIDNTFFNISGGAVFDKVVATSYDTSGIPGQNVWVVYVTGAGSRLNLSSVTQLKAGHNGGGYNYQMYRAESSGVIDFTGLQNIITPAAPADDEVMFYTNSGGQILFSALSSIVGDGMEFQTNSTMTLPLTSIPVMDVTVSSGGVLTFSNLTTVPAGMLFQISSTGVLNAPNLATLNGVTVNVSSTGAFNASNLTTFTGSTLTLNGSGAKFNSGLLTNIDNTFFNISNGAVFDKVAATSYDTSGIQGQNVWVVYVTGTGSRLDLASITQLKAGHSGNGYNYQMFRAESNGILDFTGLQIINTPVAPADDEIMFYTNNGGQILLPSLSSILGDGMEFQVNSAMTLPLFSIPDLDLSVSTGGVLTFSNLTTVPAGMLFQVSSTGILNAPSLTTLSGVTVNVSSSGAFNASNLTTFSVDTLNLNGSGAKFNSGLLTNIDNTFFNISNGAVFDRVAAISYDTSGIPGQNVWVVNVNGAGSTLDLSSVTQLTAGHNGSGYHYQFFRAENNGVIDFTGLQSINTPVAPADDEVMFLSSGGGQILFSALSSIVGDGMEFQANSPMTLPLTSIPLMDLSVSTGGVLTFSNLAAVPGGMLFQVSSTGILNAPSLSTLNGVTLNISSSGTFNASTLTTFAGSTLNLNGSNAKFNSGLLTNIDNTFFNISNGAVFDKVAATSYDTSGIPGQNIWVVNVNGAGSTLDLSSVTNLKGGHNGSGYHYQYFRVDSGGILDFSGVTSLVGLPTGSDDDVFFLTSGANSKIFFSALPFIKTRQVRFQANSGSFIDLGAVVELGIGPITVSSNGVGTLIDLHALCTYENTTLTVPNGGTILAPIAVAMADLPDKAVMGIRALGQTGSCAGNTCSASELFSYRAGGVCPSLVHGVLTLSSKQLDIDGLAVSPNFGALAFELQHDAAGVITGSRLVAVNHLNATVVAVGPVLSNRTIRGAAFLSDALWAIDSQSDTLLEIQPILGTIVGAPIPLMLNGQSYNVGKNSDITFHSSGLLILADDDNFYALDKTNGILTHLYKDTLAVEPGIFPHLSGIVFAPQPDTGALFLNGLNTNGAEKLFHYSETFTRTPILPEIPYAATFDASAGDLGSVSTLDTTPPGPVAITINPNGDGTKVTLSWTAYNEALNGNDIHHYSVYKSLTNFTNVASMTPVATTLAGVKTVALTQLQPGQQIFVAVTATDLVGNVNNAVSAVATTPVDIVAPAEVTNIVPVSQLTSIGLSWIPPTTPDLQSFRVYKDGVKQGTDIPKNTPNTLLSSLTAATGYTVRVSTVDQTGNESAGTSIFAATLLANPVNVIATGNGASVAVTWAAVLPNNLLKNYRVYVETAPFTSVVGLTPKQTISKNVLSANVAGLQNGTTYYVAVTAVNISDGENQIVTPVTAIPQVDIVGPILSNPKIGGAVLTTGTVVTKSSAIEVQATDPAGVSRVEFKLNDGANTVLLGSDGSVPYAAFWDLANYNNGPFTIIIAAFDTLENKTEQQFPVTVTLAPPGKPTITAPQNGLLTNLASIAVTGVSESGTTVDLYRNDALVASFLVVNSSGAFSTSVTLSSGANTLHAIAKGKGGASLPSTPVSVTLDSSIPQAPSGLSGKAQKEGKVQLTWNAVSSSQGTLKYNVYRALSSFETIAQASKLNATPLTVTNYNDQTSQDKTYYYRVVAVNQAGTTGEPSQQVVVTSDSTPPSATSISYSSVGEIDPTSGAFGPGVVTVIVDVNEPLLAVPFLSYAFNQGAAITVPLVQVGTQKYQGSFAINTNTSNGVGTAVFSAHDLVNHQGSEVEEGKNITIDSLGPKVTNITTTPVVPIKNDPTTPVSVVANFTLSEAPEGTPQFGYTLSESAPSSVTLSPTQVGGDAKAWTVTFTLPSEAGGNGPENLSFTYSAKDSLDNTQTTITIANSFQVYAGELPPLAVPSGLKAKALPQGHIALSWNEVPGAASYQLFRKGPNDASLAAYGVEIPATAFEDTTTLDGEYLYAIASVRVENQQKGVSAPSPTVSVVADSVAPNAPQNLTLQLNGQGVVATWAAPAVATDVKTYSLYRNNLAPGVNLNPTGLTPVLANIISLAAIDSTPSQLEHAYAVTAIDAAGNESAPSNTEYLNFTLLPVSYLGVTLNEGGLPAVTWSYSGSGSINYKVTLGDGTVLYEGPNTSFVDTGYTGGSRQYTVFVIDQNQAVSVGRTLSLPDMTLTYPEPLSLKRGVFNRLDYMVRNNGGTALTGMRLTSLVKDQVHHSAPFTLAAGETKVISVIVGGYPELSDLESIDTTIEVTPNVGELVEVISSKKASVSSAALVFSLETKDMTAGATGFVRFSVENTSGVTTEFLTAKGNTSQPSPEIRFSITDKNGNVFSTKSLHQFLGTAVITLSNGDTVARVEPGKTFTSDWILINLPPGIPAEAKAVVTVDKFHSGVGTPTHIAIKGTGTSKEISLEAPPYFGEFVSVTPNTTFGEKITIVGRAVNDETEQAEALVPLNLFLSVSGFEYKFKVLTGADGTFTHEFDPKNHVAGVYAISVTYPNSFEHPKLGEFTVNTISASPSAFKINAPVAYVAALPVTVKTGPATQATDVELKYLAQDQIGQTFPQDVQIDLPGPINVAPGSSATLEVKFGGGINANTPGLVYLRLLSAETGATPIAMIPINYTLSSANPFVTFQPTILELGVAHGGLVSGPVTIQNKGFAPLLSGAAKIVKPDGTPAPSWIYSATDLAFAELAVGATKQFELIITPTAQIPDGVYQFKFRVTGANIQPQEIPIVVAVNQSGKGGLLVHTADIYTGTFDDNGQPIPGLQGASIRLQHDTIPAQFYNAISDANGEVLFADIPAGSYHVRGSSPGHNDDSQAVQIYPGITTTQALFLINQVVTIEWSVVPLVLQDFYEIVLELIFETEVPMPVVVFEPTGIQLPDLKQGEIFMGELSLTNYGLISAINVKQILPASDATAQFEFLASIPDTIAAKQSIKIPYRVTALQDFIQDSQSLAATSGGGCVYSNDTCASYQAICANGTTIGGGSCAYWLHSHNCGSSDGVGADIDDVFDTSIGGGGNSGGGSGGGSGGSGGGGNYLPQLICVPGSTCTDKSIAPTN
jgi:fibronectin type 3 domain-containing protein